MPTSFCQIGEANLTIKISNFHKGHYVILKDNEDVGALNIAHLRSGYIKLNRVDGDVDIFKISEQGFSKTFILTQNDQAIMAFVKRINPILIRDIYEVDIRSTHYPSSALEELMVYCGEVLYRMIVDAPY